MDIDLTGVTWRKSSHSTDSGGECVEVAVWRKSSHSGANGGECVEVAISRTDPSDTVILLRDSKNPDGPALHLTPAEWHTFRHSIRTGAFDTLI